jgi:hypothetical protein
MTLTEVLVTEAEATYAIAERLFSRVDDCLSQQLLRMIAHLAPHKGQLFYYLKLVGKDVKTGDLWGA